MSEPTGIATLGINLNTFIAQLINFVVVLLVLWKFAYGPIVKMLDERSKKIEESIKLSEEVNVRVKKMEVEQKEVIASAKQEAMVILEAARNDAETRKQELLATAKKEVERVVTQGKEQLKAEKTQMIQEVKTELVGIVIAATKKILESEVDEKTSHKIASDVIEKMS